MPSRSNPNVPNRERRKSSRAKVQKRNSLKVHAGRNPRGGAVSSVLHPTGGKLAPLSAKKARKVEKALNHARKRAEAEAMEERGEVEMTGMCNELPRSMTCGRRRSELMRGVQMRQKLPRPRLVQRRRWGRAMRRCRLMRFYECFRLEMEYWEVFLWEVIRIQVNHKSGAVALVSMAYLVRRSTVAYSHTGLSGFVLFVLHYSMKEFDYPVEQLYILSGTRCVTRSHGPNWRAERGSVCDVDGGCVPREPILATQPDDLLLRHMFPDLMVYIIRWCCLFSGCIKACLKILPSLLTVQAFNADTPLILASYQQMVTHPSSRQSTHRIFYLIL